MTAVFTEIALKCILVYILVSIFQRQ